MTELRPLCSPRASFSADLVAGIDISAPRGMWLKLTALGEATLFLPDRLSGIARLLSLPQPMAGS